MKFQAFPYIDDGINRLTSSDIKKLYNVYRKWGKRELDAYIDTMFSQYTYEDRVILRLVIYRLAMLQTIIASYEIPSRKQKKTISYLRMDNNDSLIDDEIATETYEYTEKQRETLVSDKWFDRFFNKYFREYFLYSDVDSVGMFHLKNKVIVGEVHSPEILDDKRVVKNAVYYDISNATDNNTFEIIIKRFEKENEYLILKVTYDTDLAKDLHGVIVRSCEIRYFEKLPLGNYIPDPNNKRDETLLVFTKALYDYLDSFKTKTPEERDAIIKDFTTTGRGVSESNVNSASSFFKDVARFVQRNRALRNHLKTMIHLIYDDIDLLSCDPKMTINHMKKWEYESEQSSIDLFLKKSKLTGQIITDFVSVREHDALRSVTIEDDVTPLGTPVLREKLGNPIEFYNVHGTKMTVSSLVDLDKQGDKDEFSSVYFDFDFKIYNEQKRFDYEFYFSIPSFEKRYAEYLSYKKSKKYESVFNGITSKNDLTFCNLYSILRSYDTYIYAELQKNYAIETLNEYKLIWKLIYTLSQEQRVRLIRLMYIFYTIERIDVDITKKDTSDAILRSQFILKCDFIKDLIDLHGELMLPYILITKMLHLLYQSHSGDITRERSKEQEYRFADQFRYTENMGSYEHFRTWYKLIGSTITDPVPIISIKVPYIADDGTLNNEESTMKILQITDTFILHFKYDNKNSLEVFKYSFFNDKWSYNRFDAPVENENARYITQIDSTVCLIEPVIKWCIYFDFINDKITDTVCFDNSKNYGISHSKYDKTTFYSLDKALWLEKIDLVSKKITTLFDFDNLNKLVEQYIKENTMTPEEKIRLLLFYKQYRFENMVLKASDNGFVVEKDGNIITYPISDILSTNVVEYVSVDQDQNIMIIVPLRKDPFQKQVYQFIMAPDNNFELKNIIKTIVKTDLRCYDNGIGVYKKTQSKTKYLEYLASLNVPELFDRHKLKFYYHLDGDSGVFLRDDKALFVTIDPLRIDKLFIKELELPQCHDSCPYRYRVYYNRERGFLYFFGDSEIYLYYTFYNSFTCLKFNISSMYHTMALAKTRIQQKGEKEYVELWYKTDIDKSIILTLDDFNQFNNDGTLKTRYIYSSTEQTDQYEWFDYHYIPIEQNKEILKKHSSGYIYIY